MKAYTIAVTGGIGAGKSIVSQMLEVLGYPVYDTDAHAKRIIDDDVSLRQSIAKALGEDVLNADTSLNRRRVANIVFNNPEALRQLNSLVHKAVIDDILCWQQRPENQGRCRFVETAILYESGLDRIVDEVWDVEADEELRVKRVLKRNPEMTPQQVKQRIRAQRHAVEHPHPRTKVIANDNRQAVLPQVLRLLERIEQPENT